MEPGRDDGRLRARRWGSATHGVGEGSTLPDCRAAASPVNASVPTISFQGTPCREPAILPLVCRKPQLDGEPPLARNCRFIAEFNVIIGKYRRECRFALGTSRIYDSTRPGF